MSAGEIVELSSKVEDDGTNADAMGADKPQPFKMQDLMQAIAGQSDLKRSDLREAAAALGLHPRQVMRLVTLPQALRVIIPPVTNQFLNLTKNSSLAVAIGYPDVVSIANTSLYLSAANRSPKVVSLENGLAASFCRAAMASASSRASARMITATTELFTRLAMKSDCRDHRRLL